MSTPGENPTVPPVEDPTDRPRGRASGRRHLLTPTAAGGGRRVLGGVQRLPQLRVLPHAIAVAADRDEIAVMHKAVDERGGHDLVAEDFAPVLETLV